MSRVENCLHGPFYAVFEIEADGGAHFGYGTDWYCGYCFAG